MHDADARWTDCETLVRHATAMVHDAFAGFMLRDSKSLRALPALPRPRREQRRRRPRILPVFDN